MNIESLILELSTAYLTVGKLHHNAWNLDTILSLSAQVSTGIGFTVKQSNLAVKIVNHYKPLLNDILKKDISSFIDNPTYQYPFRIISTAKQITIAEDITFNKLIKVKFPFNAEYVTAIRNVRSKLPHVEWIKSESVWEFALTEESIQFVSTLIMDDQFDCDAEFLNYVSQINAIVSDIENHVPMLVMNNDTIKFKNTCSSVPSLHTTDIIEAVFAARKAGITTWDDTISAVINFDKVDNVTRKFLKHDPSEPLVVGNSVGPIDCLSTVIKHMTPCLIVIPGGSELQNMKTCVEFLNKIDITNEKMSVMFRLSKEFKSFNEFIKENELNSPITSDTQIVFISSKIPKPVLQSAIRFNSVLNLGFSGPHYTMKEYVSTHQNLIYYSPDHSQKEFNFGNL